MKAPRNIQFSRRNALTGATTKIAIEYETNGRTNYFMRSEQEVDPLLAGVRARHDMTEGKLEEGQRHLGEIPMTVWADMLADGRANDPEAIKRWLDENPFFKVWSPNARVRGNV